MLSIHTHVVTLHWTVIFVTYNSGKSRLWACLTQWAQTAKKAQCLSETLSKLFQPIFA